ncbi:hypothetical protein CGK66_14305 [Vibrio parahaemolyticus]|uniref:hypothetical protein n=1 Tax=Vibrio parahaemolyticus TaxID=670 RepID=UPI00046F9250|nr:hypothetical protein [Vibrio parahaemolyticus]TNY56379.1 hypothetical protein CGK66_14305 [Vibrio parahaemolyticus]TNY90297.1 hypothetical protein CGK59_10935 [Vibrio parahaemolyticus]
MMNNLHLVIPFIGLVALVVFVYFDAFRDRKKKQIKLHDNVSRLLDSYDEAVWDAYIAQKSELSGASIGAETAEPKQKKKAASTTKQTRTSTVKDKDELLDEALKALGDVYLFKISDVAGYVPPALERSGGKLTKTMREQQIYKRRKQRMKFGQQKIYIGRPIDKPDGEKHYTIIKTPKV